MLLNKTRLNVVMGDVSRLPFERRIAPCSDDRMKSPPHVRRGTSSRRRTDRVVPGIVLAIGITGIFGQVHILIGEGCVSELVEKASRAYSGRTSSRVLGMPVMT
jgi:hypothetical protein